MNGLKSFSNYRIEDANESKHNLRFDSFVKPENSSINQMLVFVYKYSIRESILF